MAGRSINFEWLSFTILYNIFRHAPVRILHLHWQHPFFISGGKMRTGFKSLFSLLQVYFAKLTGTKIVWTIHNLHNHENQFSELELGFSSHLAKMADICIVHCNIARLKAIETFQINDPSKITVLPQGNFEGFYTNNIESIRAREQLGLNHNEFVFLYFGLIRQYKGVLELINTFGNIKVDGVRLIIAGKVQDDELLPDILTRSALDPRVLLKLDYIPDDKLLVYFKTANIVVLPYRNIFNSGCVGLAMTVGKPVIAPRIGCIPEMLESSGNFLYDDFDANGLYQAMINACIYRDSLDEIGKRNVAVSKALDWQTIAKKTRRLYDKIV
jgi:glycosyltransferase involved in cell wall biosynthesis